MLEKHIKFEDELKRKVEIEKAKERMFEQSIKYFYYPSSLEQRIEAARELGYDYSKDSEELERIGEASYRIMSNNVQSCYEMIAGESKHINTPLLPQNPSIFKKISSFFFNLLKPRG